jgi:thioredoxin reductase
LQSQKVTSIDQDGQYLCINTADGSEYGSKAALPASGASYRRLDVPVKMIYSVLTSNSAPPVIALSIKARG